MSPTSRAAIVGGMFLALAAVGLAAEPKYQFALKRKDDTIEVVRQKEATLFVITSPSGIGSVTIDRSEGPWPAEVTLRFQRAPGDGLKALENFELVSGRMKLLGTNKDSGSLRFFLADADGKFPPGDDKPTGTVNATFSLTPAALDVRLPAHLLSGDRVQIRWIDFYRN